MSDFPEEELDALFRLHRPLVEPEAVETTLTRIVALATEAVPGCDEASVTAAIGPNHRSSPATVAHSGEGTRALDEVQYEPDEGGPCVHAYQANEVVRLDDIAKEDRWPKFRQTAAELGVASSLSIPLLLEDRPLGSINIYGRRTSGFNDRSLRLALLFAEQSAIALTNTLGVLELHRLSDQLREGMATRDIIGQAKGVLMAQRRISADDAFRVLRTTSQNLNRKLRDVAEHVATTGELPDR